MKKHITTLFCVSTIVLMVCVVLEVRQTGNLDRDTINVKTQITRDKASEETIEETGEQKEPESLLADDEEGIFTFSEEEMSRLQKEQEGLYTYDCLSENEQTVYGEIYASIFYMQEIELSTTDADQMEKVFQCVLNDHPEIFYVDGYTFTKYTRGSSVTKIMFEAAYTMDRAKIEETREQIESSVSEILSGVPVGTDEYEKVKYVYEYIIENTEYNVAAENNQNICSVFLNNQSVCQGYAKATQYLLQRAGIKATLVVGFVEGGEGHAWNLVFADGDYYYIDTTWGDASYRMTTEETFEVNNLPVINYDYLCVTTEQLCKTHRIQNVVPMPECSAVKDNYYVREGAYFVEVDEEQLEEVFEKSYADQKDYITLQCADFECYQSMFDALITEQKVFRYMNTQDSAVAYAKNEEQLSLSFWLSE